MKVQHILSTQTLSVCRFDRDCKRCRSLCFTSRSCTLWCTDEQKHYCNNFGQLLVEFHTYISYHSYIFCFLKEKIKMDNLFTKYTLGGSTTEILNWFRNRIKPFRFDGALPKDRAILCAFPFISWRLFGLKFNKEPGFKIESEPQGKWSTNAIVALRC